MLLLPSLRFTTRILLDLLSIIVPLDNIARMVCLVSSSKSSSLSLSFSFFFLPLLFFVHSVLPRTSEDRADSSPPASNVSNALTDKATSSKPPRPDTTAGSGSPVTPGVDGWVTSWGLTVCPPRSLAMKTRLMDRTQTIRRRLTQLKLNARLHLDLGHGDPTGIGSLCSALP